MMAFKCDHCGLISMFPFTTTLLICVHCGFRRTVFSPDEDEMSSSESERCKPKNERR